MAFVTPVVVTPSLKQVQISKLSVKSGNVTNTSTENRKSTPQCKIAFHDPGAKLLAKYEALSKPAPTKLEKGVASKPSSMWNKFLQEVKDDVVSGKPDTQGPVIITKPVANNLPTSFSMSSQYKNYIDIVTDRAIGYGWTGSLQDYMKIYRKNGVIPYPTQVQIKTVNDYVSNSVLRQYKAISGCPTGVYTTMCTEGNSKHQADDSRILSLSAAFRRNQLPAISKLSTEYDLRRRAYQSVHLCSYEEKLISKFPMTARTTVMAQKESMGVCTRSNERNDENVAENYMVSSVERQCKQRTVQSGVYSTSCSDGSVKDMADTKRIIGLAGKYRAGHVSQLAKEQRKFDSRKYASNVFAHQCDYEESLFYKYPNMAAAMSGMGASY